MKSGCKMKSRCESENKRGMGKWVRDELRDRTWLLERWIMMRWPCLKQNKWRRDVMWHDAVVGFHMNSNTKGGCEREWRVAKWKYGRENERHWKRGPRTQDRLKNETGVRKWGCSGKREGENDGNELCCVGGNSLNCRMCQYRLFRG